MDAGTAVDAHRILVKQNNFTSPLSRNGTSISTPSKMPSTEYQPPGFPCLCRAFPEAVISISLVQKTTDGHLLGHPDRPLSTDLPGAKRSWSTVPSQRIKVLGNVCLVSMKSGQHHKGNSLLPSKDTFPSRSFGAPSDLCSPGYRPWSPWNSGGAGDTGIPPLAYVSSFKHPP